MLYHLFNWLAQHDFRFPGMGLFQFITFRMMIAMMLSLIISTIYGKRLINFLQKKQLGETVRDLGLAGEGLGCRRRHVEHRQIELSGQLLGHRLADIADPDEPHFHGCSSPVNPVSRPRPVSS